MTKVALRLLGSIEIRDAAGGESETLPRQAKRLGLLAYLATARPRGFHRRDKLVALFWPEANQAQARHSLSQALHVIRSALGNGAVRGRGDSDVAIDEAAFSCDAVEFELAMEAREYEKALELYRGDLLEGLFVREAPEFEQWLDDERTRLREIAAGAAWALAHQRIGAGRLVEAERTAQRALLLLATDESEIRRFIQALADAGDRAAAVRFYEKFALRLQSEYEIDPDPATVAVAQALVRAPEDREQTAAVSGEVTTARQASRATWDVGITTLQTHARTVLGRGGRTLIGAALAAIVIVVTALSLPRPRPSGEALDTNRVLVVAFANNSGREEVEALGSWAQDHIIQVLTEAGFAEAVDHLTTMAVSENATEAGRAAGDVLALADETRAGTIVSGNIYAQGDSLHIQARITDANDGSSMGPVPPVVGSIAAPRELVASLGQEVALALAPLLDHELGPLEPGPQPASYEAYKAYSAGLRAYALGEGIAVAASHFERAVEADSTFARARLWAAQVYMLAGGYDSEWPSVAMADSLVAPLVESPAQLSRYERCRLEFVLALRPPRHVPSMYQATRCMVAAAPGSDDAKGELGLNALRVNRPHETLALWRESDPVKKRPGYWTIPMTAYHMLGDYEGELDITRQGLERYPENVFLLIGEARALAAL
ncbi:MAG: AfsR/SARP family transcriptional regulator, partial [Planctomycetota bacterium]